MFAPAAFLAVHLQVANADLIDRARKAVAVAGKPWPETVLTGTAHYFGVDGPYTLRFRPDGRFVQTIEGPLGDTFGDDGDRYWQRDRSGAPRWLDFEDVDETRCLMLLLTGRWLDPRAPVTLSAADGAIRFQPKGSKIEETVTLDPSTGLPDTATYTDPSGTVTIKLTDWRPAGDRMLPFRAELDQGGLTDVFAATQAAPGDASGAAYAPGKWTPTDVAFDPSVPASVECRRAVTGHVLVHPRVNGQDVGWFILDSGADSMVIDQGVADSLGLSKVGELPLVGVGGVVKAPFRPVGEFQLGPETLRGVPFVELDLHGLGDLFRVKLAGIVGYDFFRRSIVAVDLGAPGVSIYDPARFKLRGKWTPARFSSGNPAVQASFEGHRPAWFRIDTGADGTVSFHEPYVLSEHLLDRRVTRPAQMGGVGGLVAASRGKIKDFELGGHRFTDIDAIFSLAKVGAFADPYLAGNIGQDLMTPFTVYFDFGGSRIAFVPNPAAKAAKPKRPSRRPR